MSRIGCVGHLIISTLREEKVYLMCKHQIPCETYIYASDLKALNQTPIDAAKRLIFSISDEDAKNFLAKKGYHI